MYKKGFYLAKFGNEYIPVYVEDGIVINRLLKCRRVEMDDASGDVRLVSPLLVEPFRLHTFSLEPIIFS